MYKTDKIIIVGGNAAGPSAAAKAKRVNPEADVILFEAGPFISTGTCELPYLLSGEISNHDKLIFFTPEKFFIDKGVRVFTNHHIKDIDTRRKEISAINHKDNSTITFFYNKLVLATGSTPNGIDNLPISLDNAFYYKSVSNYLKVKEYIENNEISRILIIGSGYIGLELSDALKFSGYDVTVLEKENLPMPSADEQVQYLIEDMMIKSGINFISMNETTRFINRNNKFYQLKHDGLFIDFDLVIISAGVSPNNILAEQAGLKLGYFGGLKVDSRLKTSNPDIYAAGDNIEIKNRITNQEDYFPLATIAHDFGHIAGENAAGGNKIAEPMILNATFKFCRKYVSRVGLSESLAKEYSVNARSVSAVTNNKVKVMPDSTKVFGKIIFDKYSGFILGASFVGAEEISGYADIVSTMIYNKIPAVNLAKINFNYTPPLSPFLNLLSILGRKISEMI